IARHRSFDRVCGYKGSCICYRYRRGKKRVGTRGGVFWKEQIDGAGFGPERSAAVLSLGGFEAALASKKKYCDVVGLISGRYLYLFARCLARSRDGNRFDFSAHKTQVLSGFSSGPHCIDRRGRFVSIAAPTPVYPLRAIGEL